MPKHAAPAPRQSRADLVRRWLPCITKSGLNLVRIALAFHGADWPDRW